MEAPFDRMTGEEFEEFCVRLLAKNGFRDIATTPISGDRGVDLLAAKDGKTYAIQCKCYSGNVGNDAVQQVYSGCRIYRADVAVVMSNRKFTRQAMDDAIALGVDLWDRDVIWHMEAYGGVSDIPSVERMRSERELEREAARAEALRKKEEAKLLAAKQREEARVKKEVGRIAAEAAGTGRHVGAQLGKSLLKGLFMSPEKTSKSTKGKSAAKGRTSAEAHLSVAELRLRSLTSGTFAKKTEGNKPDNPFEKEFKP